MFNMITRFGTLDNAVGPNLGNCSVLKITRDGTASGVLCCMILIINDFTIYFG
jgi:hypothetical protein